MKFSTKKFDEAKFLDRKEEVPVPDLAAFFEGEEVAEGKAKAPVWIVRGLEGIEIAEARDAMTRNKNLASIIEGLLSTSDTEKIQSMKEALGISGGVAPDDYVKRISILVAGSVDPVIDQSQAVRLALAYGVTFYTLTDKILALTGMGKKLGEALASGQIQE